jgi:transposase-like protein
MTPGELPPVPYPVRPPVDEPWMKALAAVRNVFGERAIVQRCQAHKLRNVVDQLPDDMKPSVRQALREAYAAGDAAGCLSARRTARQQRL